MPLNPTGRTDAAPTPEQQQHIDRQRAIQQGRDTVSAGGGGGATFRDQVTAGREQGGIAGPVDGRRLQTGGGAPLTGVQGGQYPSAGAGGVTNRWGLFGRSGGGNSMPINTGGAAPGAAVGAGGGVQNHAPLGQDEARIQAIRLKQANDQTLLQQKQKEQAAMTGQGAMTPGTTQVGGSLYSPESGLGQTAGQTQTQVGGSLGLNAGLGTTPGQTQTQVGGSLYQDGGQGATSGQTQTQVGGNLGLWAPEAGTTPQQLPAPTLGLPDLAAGAGGTMTAQGVGTPVGQPGIPGSTPGMDAAWDAAATGGGAAGATGGVAGAIGSAMLDPVIGALQGGKASWDKAFGGENPLSQPGLQDILAQYGFTPGSLSGDVGQNWATAMDPAAWEQRANNLYSQAQETANTSLNSNERRFNDRAGRSGLANQGGGLSSLYQGYGSELQNAQRNIQNDSLSQQMQAMQGAGAFANGQQALDQQRWGQGMSALTQANQMDTAYNQQANPDFWDMLNSAMSAAGGVAQGAGQAGGSILASLPKLLAMLG